MGLQALRFTADRRRADCQRSRQMHHLQVCSARPLSSALFLLLDPLSCLLRRPACAVSDCHAVSHVHVHVHMLILYECTCTCTYACPCAHAPAGGKTPPRSTSRGKRPSHTAAGRQTRASRRQTRVAPRGSPSSAMTGHNSRPGWISGMRRARRAAARRAGRSRSCQWRTTWLLNGRRTSKRSQSSLAPRVWRSILYSISNCSSCCTKERRDLYMVR